MLKKQNYLWMMIVLIIMMSCSLSAVSSTQPVKPSGEETSTSVTVPTVKPVQGTGRNIFNVDLGKPFAQGFGLSHWEATTAQQTGIILPFDPNNALNPQVIAQLTEEQKEFLTKNGFVVVITGDEQFYDTRERIGKVYGQPYYLTTDAVYHAMHQSFNETLKALERDYLQPTMADLLNATLAEVLRNLDQVQNTPLEQDVRLAAAYLTVGLKLMAPETVVDPRLETLVKPQLEQIAAQDGIQLSALIPGFQDDYGAYKPVGHYAGDPTLEAYFQGMTWLGRVNFAFRQKEPLPSRAPLMITLALQKAQVGTTPASEVWGRVHEILTFLFGPTDDPGPLELSLLMGRIYGTSVTITDLADEALWQEFLKHTADLPAPQINSTFVSSSVEMETTRSWRFLGQRFTLDAFILQNLVFDKVGTQQNPRLKPSGMDVMAVLGSATAQQELKETGETAYQNYESQMQKMQTAVQAQPEEEWLLHFYSTWLYAFVPQVLPKETAYPPYMRTTAWGYKELNSALGSWAELKHDTALYTKMPEPMGGGGPPVSPSAPAYVEPNPDVFYRLAYASRSLVNGLKERGIAPEPPAFEGAESRQLSLYDLLIGMERMAEKLEALGDIAGRELLGEQLSQEDYELILGCLGPVECAVAQFRAYGMEANFDPIPVIAAVSGAGEGEILQAGVGYLDRLYAIVPIEGQPQIAQGSIFSYYEFTQPRNNRLTDEQWQQLLAINPPRPDWINRFAFSGGKAMDVLAFRIGDVYILTEAGANPPLNLRKSPSKNAAVVKKLDMVETYLTIIDGPVNADGYRWWKIKLYDDTEGWIVENQEWYQRSYY
ncbi:MAG: DUF3160 domain-containing protein [Anaerolineales bacterium]|jgi:hypothetical protein